MKMSRYWLVLLLLASMAVYANLYGPGEVRSTVQPQRQDWDAKIDGWRFVNDVEFEPSKYDALDPDALLFKNYADESGRLVNFVLVYHRNDRWGAHDPLVCYKSQGWRILEKPHTVLLPLGDKAIEINRFVVTKGDYRSLVYFNWFSSNRKITASRNRQMVDMVLGGALQGFMEGGFLRFSTSLNGLDERTAVQSLNDFVVKFTRMFLEGQDGESSNQDS